MCSNDLYLEQKGLQVCFFVLHIPNKKGLRYNFLTLNQATSRVSRKSPFVFILFIQNENFSNILFSVHVKWNISSVFMMMAHGVFSMINQKWVRLLWGYSWNCFSSYCTKASMWFEGDQLATSANVLRVCFDSGPTDSLWVSVQVSWVVGHGSSTVSKPSGSSFGTTRFKCCWKRKSVFPQNSSAVLGSDPGIWLHWLWPNKVAQSPKAPANEPHQVITNCRNFTRDFKHLSVPCHVSSRDYDFDLQMKCKIYFHL